MPVQDVFIPPDVSASNGKSDPKSKIQKLLQDREALAAQRAEVAEIERITAEAEREKRRLETDLDAIGSGRHGNGYAPNSHAEEEERQKLTTQAVTLLNAGVDPRTVGQILAGSTPITPITMAQPSHNGDSMMKMVKDLVVLITGVKRDAEIERMKEKLDKLDQDLKDERLGKKRQSENGHGNVVTINPLKQASEAAQSVGLLYQTFRDIGLVREPTPATGTNLEVVKETHRHNERIREIELEEVRKGDKADIITSGIEKLGKVMADVIKTRAESPTSGESVNTKPQVQMFKCTCGADLAAIPEATEITCPRCSNVYARRAKDADTKLGESIDIQPDQPRADDGSGVQLPE